MIKIAGSIRRSFIFPADVAVAYAFYGNMVQTFSYLPHISLHEQFGDAHYRMRYNTVELGAYNIHIFADIHTQFEDDAFRLTIIPANGPKPVKSKARMNASTTQGTFQIESQFTAADADTHVEFSLQLQATLPPPMGLRFMPRSVVDRITQGITEKRMREIIEGFITNSVTAFHQLSEETTF